MGETPANTTGLTRRALAGTGWSTVATAGKQVLTLASVMTVARLLGPGAYGIVNMAAVVTAFISNFRDLGTASAIIQKPSVTPRLLSTLFWLNLSFGAVLSLIVLGVAPLAAAFFHTAEVQPVLRALALSLFLASCGVVHNALLARDMTFKAIAVTDLSAAFVAYLVALAGALAGWGVWALVFASIANSAVATFGYVVGARFHPSLLFCAEDVRSIWRFSSNLSAFGVVNYAYRNADNLIVGRRLGSIALGYYGMAYNLMLTPIQNVSSVIAQVLMPAFARIQGDDERFRIAFVKAVMLTALLTFPMMAGLGVVADPLIRSILGPKWLGAIVPFEILSVVGLVQSIHTMTGVIFQAKGRTDLMFRWSLAVLASTVAAFLIGVRWGIAGVAAAYASVFLVGLTIPGFTIAFRLIGLKVADFGGALLPQLSITLLMTMACLAWRAGFRMLGQTSSWAELISTVAVGASVYLIALARTKPPALHYADEILSSSGNAAARRTIGLLRKLRLFAKPGV